MNKKEENIFLVSPYYNKDHLDRYNDYYKNNPNYTIDEIVLYVEIGLDKEFYTNITELKDYKSIITIVNKYNKLPENYSFDDLVTIDKPYSNDGKKLIRKVAYDSLIEMINEAKKDDIDLIVISSYRTNEYQDNLFYNSIKNNGLKHALMYSAKKGHSEHQLGLAIDLNTVEDDFQYTKEYKWLKENSYKYGFIERYPKNKEYITGYGYEPWHYRYLGKDISTIIHNNNITFEEYLVKYS